MIGDKFFERVPGEGFRETGTVVAVDHYQGEVTVWDGKEKTTKYDWKTLQEKGHQAKGKEITAVMHPVVRNPSVEKYITGGSSTISPDRKTSASGSHTMGDTRKTLSQRIVEIEHFDCSTSMKKVYIQAVKVAARDCGTFRDDIGISKKR